ncbi:MAG: toprim domain-containing protein [Fimbriimonas sp.]
MPLSLAEIENNNPLGARRGRFFCPRCQPQGGRTPDLSVDVRRGVYHCFKCGGSGVLEEHRRQAIERGLTIRRRVANRQAQAPVARPVLPIPARPEVPVSTIPAAYVEDCLRDFPGSPADDYERSRGIHGERTGMGFDPRYPFLYGDEWVQEPAVVFFFYDDRGRCVGKQGRMLRQAEPGQTAKVSFGRVSQGVFNARALKEAEVVLCEGPNTAAALVERGYPAIALGGKTAQPWLLEAVESRRVWVAFDNDAPGRQAAAALLAELRQRGADAEAIFPPEEGQDWNDLLLMDPEFTLPGVLTVPYVPTVEDVWAECRRMLRHARGEARDMLEQWEYALASGHAPGGLWWRQNGAKLCALL